MARAAWQERPDRSGLAGAAWQERHSSGSTGQEPSLCARVQRTDVRRRGSRKSHRRVPRPRSFCTPQPASVSEQSARRRLVRAGTLSAPRCVSPLHAVALRSTLRTILRRTSGRLRRETSRSLACSPCSPCLPSHHPLPLGVAYAAMLLPLRPPDYRLQRTGLGPAHARAAIVYGVRAGRSTHKARTLHAPPEATKTGPDPRDPISVRL